MSRYIDADKIRYREMQNEVGFGWYTSREHINGLPSEDVEPVVRCAECKFFNRKDATTNGMCRCDVDKLWQSAFYRPYRRFGDFCSHGAKMDGEVNQ